MLGTIREFDPVQHALYDQPGKRAVATFFEQNGCQVRHEPFGPMGVDLEVTTPAGNRFYVEPEVRGHAWAFGPWPFPTVHIVERKHKYTRLDRPVLFASVRADLRAVMFTWGKELTPDRLQANPTNKWECVYSVPLDHTRYVELSA